MSIITPRLRSRITLQAATISNDNYCNSVTDWCDIITIWADIKPIKAHEYFALEKRDNVLIHHVIVRFSALIKIGQRIIFCKRILLIKSLTCYENDLNFLSILAEEMI